jgi:hypothetical protein
MSPLGHSRSTWPIWPAGSGPLRSASDRRPALPRNDATGQKATKLFDQLVGGREEHRWDGQPKRLSRLEIDKQIEFGRLHDR